MTPKLPKITEAEKQMSLFQCSRFKLGEVNLRDCITEGQLCIFNSLIVGTHKRIQILCSTQYGKSLIVALSCIILACILGKKVAIIAPNANKAKIIMRYVIEHLGDYILFENELESESKLDRLRLEGTKERIAFRNGGVIFIISANESNSQKKIESAMGEGAEIVIMDEANLISDDVEATLFRMIAGKGKDAIYVKIGNPWYTLPPYSHFYNSWKNPNYYRVFIDDRQAVAEGRYTEDFLDEARDKPFFDILYRCLFPEEDEMDNRGYKPLVIQSNIRMGVTKEMIKKQIEEEIDEQLEKGIAIPKLKYKLMIGADIGGGGDYNAYTLRYNNLACLLGKNRSSDTMVNVSELEKIAEEWKDYGFKWSNVNIDDIGIGQGVSDRCLEKGYKINKVRVGTSASDKTKYFNLKAELYWKLKIWTERKDSALNEMPEWAQLTWIRYKVSSDKQVKIEPKEELKKRTHKSPDFAESLMLTFKEPAFIGFL